MKGNWNRPPPTSKHSHFQNETRRTTFLVKMSFICMRMKNHFQIKGWALNLVLIQRPGGTRKWPIAFFFWLWMNEGDILLAEHYRITAFSNNQSENQNQTWLACTRLLTYTDSAHELKGFTLYLLNSLSSSGDTLVVCLQCLKKSSCWIRLERTTVIPGF